ncbi:unnamed protein product [Protopolystoma xenopodis]|uniref:Uncharacterized protein n=1 Tax=Protopolystoma xenopodis TaxID=117903 RepID=A0A3S5C2Y4_9PLAT|nr:unnamed protein product [Protopolystoma xenopodis]
MLVWTLRRGWPDASTLQWFNTPNSYTKEVLETVPGSQHLVTHWTSDRESALQANLATGGPLPPATCHPLTPAAVPLGACGGPPTDTALQLGQATNASLGVSLSLATGGALSQVPRNMFAPQGPDPKEFKDRQKRVSISNITLRFINFFT